MAIKEDCAFLMPKPARGQRKCIAITPMICKKSDKCPFFKTFEQERDALYKYGLNKGKQK